MRGGVVLVPGGGVCLVGAGTAKSKFIPGQQPTGSRWLNNTPYETGCVLIRKAETGISHLYLLHRQPGEI